jgi:hypothetical protein
MRFSPFFIGVIFSAVGLHYFFSPLRGLLTCSQKTKRPLRETFLGRNFFLYKKQPMRYTDWTNNIVQYRLSPHCTICLIPSAFTPESIRHKIYKILAYYINHIGITILRMH